MKDGTGIETDPPLVSVGPVKKYTGLSEALIITHHTIHPSPPLQADSPNTPLFFSLLKDLESMST